MSNRGAARNYDDWLQRNAVFSVYVYSGLIAFFLPLFHFVLRGLPGVVPGSDSLGLRVLAAGLSLTLAASLTVFPTLRRHALVLQNLNAGFAVIVIAMLVVNSGNHYAYIASGFLVIVGAQQAFYRVSDLLVVFAFGLLFQAVYSNMHGIFFQPLNLASLGTFATGYVLAVIPAGLRIRIQEREIRTRMDAQRVKAELQEVNAITQLGRWSRDITTGAVAWSPELCQIFALPHDASDLAGRYKAAVHPDDRALFDNTFARCRERREPLKIEHRIVAADGGTRWVELNGQYEYDDDGAATRWTSAVLDITGRKAAEERLLQLARYDPLTGLPNRTTIEERLTALLTAEPGARCAVLFLDLDRFKDLNDTLGHEVGDQLLDEAGARFLRALPARAVLGRWGGDEFIAILPEADEASANDAAVALIAAAALPFRAAEMELTLSVSVGVALSPVHGSDPGILIRNADTAMYEAKRNPGQGCAFFTAQLHAAAVRRQFVQHNLLRAVSDNRFELHYQPIIEAARGTIVGAEALVRWRDETGALRMPVEFIPAAEANGTIVALGEWVMRAGCEQLARWQAAGIDLSLSVNVSPRQFARGDLVERFSRIMDETGVDPRMLEFEITEAAIMSNVEPVLRALQALRAMGSRVSIDDFGTGYSSFAYLNRFEFDGLKIDRSFVNGIELPRNGAIVMSIITVAHTLGLSVTAEGVETRAQRATLGQLGCDRLQGFGIERPVPVERFAALLRRAGAAGGPPRHQREAARVAQ